MRVDEIYCETPLAGHLIFMKNQDVPGVIGHVGGVLGRNKINIANFSLGRRDAPLRPGEPLEAVAVVSTDGRVPEHVLAQLRENPAVKLARAVEFVSFSWGRISSCAADCIGPLRERSQALPD